MLSVQNQVMNTMIEVVARMLMKRFANMVEDSLASD
jgi:hypothetical protein